MKTKFIYLLAVIILAAVAFGGYDYFKTLNKAVPEQENINTSPTAGVNVKKDEAAPVKAPAASVANPGGGETYSIEENRVKGYKQTEPKDKASCEKVNGYWVAGGVNYCVLKTADAGKVCSDPTDCEGKACIADLTKEQWSQAESNPDKLLSNVTGKCTGFTSTYGCNTYVVGGKAGLKSTQCDD